MGEMPPNNPEWADPAEWRMLGAHQLCDHPTARGEVIVGPYPGGVQVLFPPGTHSNLPANNEYDYTNKGWRLGIFLEPRPEPDSLETKTIPEVVGILSEEAPVFIEFVKKRCTIIAGNARLVTRLDSKGTSFSATTIERYLTNLEKVREEAAQAFGQEWVDENLAIVPDKET